MPDVFVIGGPNGAGKTTAAHAILPAYLGVSQFVNADDIARGLSAFAPESVAIEAGRLMLQRIDQLAKQHVRLRLRNHTRFPIFRAEANFAVKGGIRNRHHLSLVACSRTGD